MSKRKLSPKELQVDLDAFAALEALSDYKESNPAFSKANALAAKTKMQTDETAHVQSIAAEKAARDTKVDSQWAFHDLMIGVKRQTEAQYGEDSNEVQSLGLKKKSEYKKRTAGKPKPPTS
jgi:hypothetical protein